MAHPQVGLLPLLMIVNPGICLTPCITPQAPLKDVGGFIVQFRRYAGRNDDSIMFYTFVKLQQDGNGNFRSSNPQGQGKKRSKVATACFRCRSLRVRCAQSTPCPQCVEAKTSCKKPSVNESDCLLQRYTRLRWHEGFSDQDFRRNEEVESTFPQSQAPALHSSLDQRFEPPVSEGRKRRKIPSAQADPVNTSPREQSTGFDLSATGFAVAPHEETPPINAQMPGSGSLSSKVVSFIELASKALHQYPQEPLRDPIYVDYDTPFIGYRTSDLESDCPPVTILSRDEVDCFVDIFWQYLEVDIPILDRRAFQLHYESLWSTDGRQHTISPLVDAVIAVSSQYAHGADLIERVLGLRHPRCTYHGDVGLGAFCYLRRCRRMINDTSTMGEPTLATVQTYVFMTIYLLNAGQYQTAYTIVGLAIRLAYSLNLHRNDIFAPQSDEVEWERRTWWMLVLLDLKCSAELGRPTATRGSAVTCSFPSPDIRGTHVKLEYHVWTAKLIAARLSVNENLARNTLDGTEASEGLFDVSAEGLEHALAPLEEWRKELERSDTFAHLDLEDPLSLTPEFHLLPSWSQRQAIFLSLQYHDALCTLYRPFIIQSLSTRLRREDQANRISRLSDKGLKHALSVIDIIFFALRASDLLYGRFELYSVQWNAILNLVLFILAYPLAMDPDTAISKLDRAFLLFGMSEKRYSVAKRAGALLRKLRATGIRIIQDANGGADGELGHQGQQQHETSAQEQDVVGQDTQYGADESSEILWSWMQDLETVFWSEPSTELDVSLNEGWELR